MSDRVLFIRDRAIDYPSELTGFCGADYLPWSEISWNAIRPEDLARSNVALIVAEARNRTQEAIELFGRLSSLHSSMASLVVLSEDADRQVLDRFAELVDDFVLWPSTREELAARVRRLVPPRPHADEKDAAVARLLQEVGLAQLKGEDQAFLRALHKLPVLAASDMAVLISGETGTGKEFSARAIHGLGKNSGRPFVPVDCGAIPDHVFENEMFGHVRGGYTDAYSDQKGLAEIADGGVLFLDEVDSLSAAAQSKLLRFLQERTFKPLGSSRFVNVVVRVIAATNQDLEDCVQKGRFRADLFYRLNVLRLWLPPLRERPLDIPILARHFLRTMDPEKPAERRHFSCAALRALSAHGWPGNVRELQNVVQQAALMADTLQIRPEHLPLRGVPQLPQSAETYRAARAQALEVFERAYVEKLLRNNDGNVTHAAKEANRNRRSIGRLIKKYNISRNGPSRTY